MLSFALVPQGIKGCMVKGPQAPYYFFQLSRAVMMSELVSSQFNTTQLTLTFTDSLIPQITALFLALSSAMDVKCPVIMGVICNVYCLYLGNRCKGIGL